jgi:hypothetical protein
MNYEYANEQEPEAEPDVTFADFFFRGLALIALAILAVLLLAQTGCTMPRTVNFAPLITNGNSVPVSP